MLAARDQENLLNTHQTTAASKPLNQTVRALNPKTPSNLKTPFRATRNDENRPIDFKGQKTVLKDGPSKLDKNAFHTPAPQRERAPLGLKTTNAKAQAFKTPAPLQQVIKKPSSTTRRSARSKIVIAPSEPVQTDILSEEEEEEEPDYGYAPPPIKELDDPPIEFGYDQSFPQFKGENMFRGYGEIYCTSPTDEHGVSIRQKREEETWRKFYEERMSEASKPVKYPMLPSEEELDSEVDAMIAAGPNGKTTESRVDTVQARSAASLLSRPDQKLPSAATRPTKASEQKAKPVPRPLISKPNTSQTLGHPPANVSKNTIGFPKAKQAQSIIPKAEQMRAKRPSTTTKKITQSEISPREFVELYGKPPVGSTMHSRLVQLELLEEELREEGDLAGALFEADFFGGQDDDEEVFQLPMPE
jgi:hypothetical protein